MYARKRYVAIATIAFLFSLYFWHLPVHAAAVNCFVTNDARDVLVYARLTDCFTKDIEAAILAGVPTTFTFFMDLYQQRSRWLDKKIASLTVRHTIKYDNVKRLFYLTRDYEKGTSSYRDFEEAKQAMTDVNGLAIAPMKALRRNEYYYVQVKAKSDRAKLPFPLEYVLFFISPWDFETDWHREGFFY